MKLTLKRPSMAGLLDTLIAAGLSLAAFLAFFATLCHFPDPGISARRVAVAAGLYPQFDLQSPLWRMAAAWVAAWPGSSVTGRVHLLNACVVALSVGVVYLLVQTATYTVCRGRSGFLRQALLASRLAGTVAAVSAATCLPIWWTATRAADGAIGLFLVLVACYLLMLYLRDARHGELFASAFLCGLAIAEWSPAILAVPLLAAAAIIRAVAANRRRVTVLSGAALSAACGLLMYVATAARCVASYGGQLRGMKSTGMAILTMCREQYSAVRFFTHETGWLITLAVTLIPCGLAVAFGRDALSEIKSNDFERRSRAWSFPLLHLAMTATAIACLANTPVAPWFREDASGRFLLPSVMVSAVLGYVTAYWFLLPRGWWPSANSVQRRQVTTYFGPVAALLLIGATATFASRTLPRLDRRSSLWMYRYAEAVLDSLNGQTWLVTDGFADDSLRIAAANRELPLLILNLREARHPVYMRYVAAEMVLPQHRNAAELGVDSLVRDVIRRDDSAPLRLALAAAPTLWQAGDLRAIPRGLVFIGAAREPPRQDLDALCRLHTRLRAAATPLPHREGDVATSREMRIRNGIQARITLVGRHLANLAMSCDAADLAKDMRALEEPRIGGRPGAPDRDPTPSALPGVYLSAHELAPVPGHDVPGQRAVSLMRQARQAANTGDTETADALLKEAGNAGVQVFHTELERAVMYAHRGDAQLALGHVTLSLEAKPDFLPAWVIRAGIHEMLGDRAGMALALGELETRGAPAAFTAAIRARIAMRDGNLELASEELATALESRPADPHLLQQRTSVCLSLGNTGEAETLAVRLLRVDPDNALGHHVRGRRQVAEKQLALAEQSLRRSVESSPTPQALNDLAWVLHERGKDEESETFAKRAVDMAPRMAHAWHTLGIASEALGKREAAREAFQECLRINPGHTDARLRLGMP